MESVKNGIQFTALTNYLTKFVDLQSMGVAVIRHDCVTEQQRRYTESL